MDREFTLSWQKLVLLKFCEAISTIFLDKTNILQVSLLQEMNMRPEHNQKKKVVNALNAIIQGQVLKYFKAESWQTC